MRRQLRTVLVVDDETAVQTLLKHFLGENGFRIKTASGVGEAISILEQGAIDAVVSDVRMPQRSSLELLEFIRSDPTLSEIPVLVLTGATLTPEEEATIARDHGSVFYKSENLESLAAQLEQVIV